MSKTFKSSRSCISAWRMWLMLCLIWPAHRSESAPSPSPGAPSRSPHRCPPAAPHASPARGRGGPRASSSS
eukprot:15377315-Alexandrium_andersonii.AAC.1